VRDLRGDGRSDPSTPRHPAHPHVGELRTAAELGVPIAALTVSESTIYGRFGFASAAQAAHWEIDTRHVRWAGPTPAGASTS
jgi:predicted acetyltransferase